MKKVLTEADIEALAHDGVVQVLQGMIVTPLAREHASRKGIRLVYGGGTVPSSETLQGMTPSGVSQDTAGLIAAVMEEVTRAVRDLPSPPVSAMDRDSPAAPLAQQVPGSDDALAPGHRAVVVATGMNRPGVAAAITASVSEFGCDIEDISQTILSEFFSMILVVNLAGLGSAMSFKAFKEHLEEAGRGVGAEVMVMHEAILHAMHRV